MTPPNWHPSLESTSSAEYGEEDRGSVLHKMNFQCLKYPRSISVNLFPLGVLHPGSPSTNESLVPTMPGVPDLHFIPRCLPENALVLSTSVRCKDVLSITMPAQDNMGKLVGRGPRLQQSKAEFEPRLSLASKKIIQPLQDDKVDTSRDI